MKSRESELAAFFEDLTKNGPVVLMSWTLEKHETKVFYISENVKPIFGYHPEDLLSNKIPLTEIIYEEDRLMFAKRVRDNILSNMAFWESKYRIYSGEDGRICYIHAYTYCVKQPNEQTIKIYTYLLDETSLAEQLSIHQSLENRWRAAVESAREGVWDWNLLTDDVYFSPIWKSMIGYEDEELQNQLGEWSIRVHPEDLQHATTEINRHIAGEVEYYESIHRLQHKNGTYRWILDRGKVTEFKDGKPTRMIGTHVDITEKKELEELLMKKNAQLEQMIRQVQTLSITDPLTGLFNRRKMMEELEVSIDKSNHNHQVFSIAIIDLDFFKAINDTYGHACGDEVLKHFAQGMNQNMTESIIGRWGGEEFLLVFKGLHRLDAYKKLLLFKQQNADHAFTYEGQKIEVSFSSGVVEYMENEDVYSLLKRADRLLYAAKEKGRDQIKMVHE